MYINEEFAEIPVCGLKFSVTVNDNDYHQFSEIPIPGLYI